MSFDLKPLEKKSSRREILTYSALSTFRNCRRRFWWRYVVEIVPINRGDPALRFGTIIHDALETHHSGGDPIPLIESRFSALPAEYRGDRLLAIAMMQAYLRIYAVENFKVLELERPFETEIINPATGAASRSFVMAGKMDALLGKDGGTWLGEHKTAARIDQAYLERLWMDFQIHLYSAYEEQITGRRVDGVLYNVLTKAKLKQAEGETEEAFKVRHAELCASNKSGKSTAKRQMPESDEDFAKRLAEKYREPGMFHREPLILSRDRVKSVLAEVWELTQALLIAHRGGITSFYQNTGDCWKYNKPCPYWALCLSENSPNVQANLYEHKPAHEELNASTSPVDEMPF